VAGHATSKPPVVPSVGSAITRGVAQVADDHVETKGPPDTAVPAAVQDDVEGHDTEAYTGSSVS
jgi:hypothetical protein